MRISPKLLPTALAVAVVMSLGSCARTFGAVEQAGDNLTDAPIETTTTVADDSATSVPANGSTSTKPKGTKTTTSKPSQPDVKDDGFGGKPPSFPEFTFTATRSADGTVKVTGTGCAGGKVSLYAEGSGDGEGGDPIYANPDASGNWSVSAKLPAGQLKGTCFGVGTSGQSHVGGSLTVTIS